MDLHISMIRDYLKKKGQNVSAINGPNTLFRSFRLLLPDFPEKEMLYLHPHSSTITFICGEGSFTSYNLSLQLAVALTLEACQYYDHWEKALREAVWETPDYQALIDISEEVFENPMLITNWQGKVLGYTSSYKNAAIREFWTQLVNTGVLPISCLQNLRESDYFDILKEENKVNLLHFNQFDYTCILGLIHEKHEILLHFQIIEYNP